jgi:hypothetical protein
MRVKYKYMKLRKKTVKSIFQVVISIVLIIAVKQCWDLTGRLDFYQWRDRNVIAPCENFCSFTGKVEAQEPTVKQPLSHDDIVLASRHPKEIEYIWVKESSKGRNPDKTALHNICKAQGKSNEFGYGGIRDLKCFDTFQDAVNAVDSWLDTRTAESLCYYNTGIRNNNCDYIR